MMEHAMEHTVKWPGAGIKLANAPRFIRMFEGPGIFPATINPPPSGCAGRSVRI